MQRRNLDSPDTQPIFEELQFVVDVVFLICHAYLLHWIKCKSNVLVINGQLVVDGQQQ